jgi:hypothetical protein
LMVTFTRRVAEREPRCFPRRGSLPPPVTIQSSAGMFWADDWTDDCAFGADEIALLSSTGKNSENYVF